MASGTLSAITENGTTLSVSVVINGATYTVVISRTVFDTYLTNAEKQAFVVAMLTTARRTNRQYENIYPALIGSVLTIPD
jgi:fibrillarin-like rRNA methylase